MHVKEKSVVLSLSTGAIRGEASDGVFAFRGVPYGDRAQPGNRLSEVKPPSAWTGERDATAPGSVFPQAPSRLANVMGNGIDRSPQSEDAFLLNVWAPQDAQRRPVFVFIHGGGFLSGGGTAAWYDGERVARESGMVVVTVNYRLGALGHFTDARDARGANRAVRDLIRALEWVQEHISRFGGDPASVAVGGQSAGAYYAWLLGVSPASKGLLHRNAMFSLPALPPLAPEEAYRTSLALLDAAGEQDIGALSVKGILAAQSQLMRARARFGEVSVGFRPVAEDGLVPDWLFDLPRAAREAHVSSSLLGFTADECRLHGGGARGSACHGAAGQGMVRDQLRGGCDEALRGLCRRAPGSHAVHPAGRCERVSPVRRHGTRDRKRVRHRRQAGLSVPVQRAEPCAKSHEPTLPGTAFPVREPQRLA